MTTVAIAGGGVVGSSIAFHLRAGGFAGRVVVVERDPSYRYASSRLAFGGIRQQFCSRVAFGPPLATGKLLHDEAMI